MKTNLLKWLRGLCAVALAVFAGSGWLYAEGETENDEDITVTNVISINFDSDNGSVSGSAGLQEAQGWNNLTGASGTDTNLTVWNGSEDTTSTSSVTWSSQITWTFTTNVTDEFLKGYLDDGGSGCSITVSNLPFTTCDVIVYCATDSGNCDFTPVTINGTSYRGSETETGIGYATESTDTWGATQSATAAYGTNALRVNGLKGTKLEIQGGHTGDNSSRGGIAAIQIVGGAILVVDQTYTEDTTLSEDVATGTLTADNCVLDVSSVNCGAALVATNGGSLTVTEAQLDTVSALTVGENCSLTIKCDALPDDIGLLEGKFTFALPSEASIADSATVTVTVVGYTVASTSVADGKVTVTLTEAVATLTGSAWWWDYEFNGNGNNIGSDTTNLSWDGGRPFENNEYTDADTDGNQMLRLPSRPWRDVSAWLEAATFVMKAKVGSQANGVLVSFGSSTNNSCKTITLMSGVNPADGDMRLVYTDGTSSVTDLVDNFSVPNATSSYHLYAFTLKTADGKTTVNVYVDGALSATKSLDTFTLGTGFQIASVHGGCPTGLNRLADDDTATMDFLRVANTILSEDALKNLSDAYPYVSPNGTAIRTVTSSDTEWVATSDVWTQATLSESGDGTTSTAMQTQPNANTNVTLTADGENDVTLALNVNAAGVTYESLTVKGDKSVSLTSAADAGVMKVSGVTTVQTDLTVDATAVSLSAVNVAAGKTLTFDFTNYAFANVWKDTTVTLTGVATLGDEAKVMATGIPETLPAQLTSVTISQDSATQEYKLYITFDSTIEVSAEVSSACKWSEIEWKWSDGSALGNTVALTALKKATLTVSADVALTMDVTAEVASELVIKGAGALAIHENSSNKLNVLNGGATTIDTEVTVTAGAAVLKAITINAGCSLTVMESIANVGTITANNGELVYSGTFTESMGLPAGYGTLRVASGTLTLSAANGYFDGAWIIDEGATLTNAGNGNYNPFAGGSAGSMTVNGTLLFSGSDGAGHLWMPVGGSGVVRVTTGGYLCAALEGPSVIIDDGASFNSDGTTLGTITIVSGKTLSGSGSIANPVVLNDGATLDASSGALTISGGVTLPTGGKVTVTLAEGAAAGDTVLTCATAGLDLTCLTGAPNGLKFAANADGTAIVLAKSGAFKVGDTVYETLAAAVTNATSGSTITIDGDAATEEALAITEPILITTDVTLDLNGQKLTLASSFTDTDKHQALFVVCRGGTLTIKDSSENGTIDASTLPGTVYAAIKMTKAGEAANGDTATLTVEGGTLKGAYYAICGNGTRHDTAITVTGGTLEGTVDGDNVAIYHPQKGTLTITGGTLKGATGLYVKAGRLSITGGEIIGNGQEVAYTTNKSGFIATGDALVLDVTDGYAFPIVAEIEGGTFTSANAKAVASYAEDGQDDYLTKAFISGGAFSSLVDVDYCAEGYLPAAVTANDTTTYTVKNEGFTVGEDCTWYATFSDALAAVQKGDTLTMLEDAYISTPVVLESGTEMTLDFFGHWIECNSDYADNFTYNGAAYYRNAPVVVRRGASLTLNDTCGKTFNDEGAWVGGGINYTFAPHNLNQTYAAVKVTELGDGDGLSEGDAAATLIVNGGYLKGYYYGICGNGSRHNTVITINGGYITGCAKTKEVDDNAGIYHPQQGVLTITGGTIEGATGVYVKSGKVTVSGGTIIGNGDAETEYTTTKSGFYPTGDAIVFDVVDGYKQPITAEITGGAFTSTNAAAVGSYAQTGEEAVESVVSGGTFIGKEDTDNDITTPDTFINSEGSVTTINVPETISDGAKDVVQAAMKDAKVAEITDYTLTTGNSDEEGTDVAAAISDVLELFDLEPIVTTDTETNKATLTVSYEFGISAATVSDGANGKVVTLTAKVIGGTTNAGDIAAAYNDVAEITFYADGTKLDGTVTKNADGTATLTVALDKVIGKTITVKASTNK